MSTTRRATTEPPTSEQVWRQLRTVPEPCGLLMREEIDICQMGLVEKVECEGGTVRVELVLTDTSCVHFTGMRRYITDVLTALPGVSSVEVTVSTTELWTPDRRETSPTQRSA
jgi:metal-sulfur cluster biosynthetic enzyme